MRQYFRNFRRSQFGRFVTRTWRRSPRSLAYAALLVGCCAIAEIGRTPYIDAVGDGLHGVLIAGLNHDPLNEALFACILLGALMGGAALLVGGACGAAGLTYLVQVNGTARLRMKRAFRLLIATTVASGAFAVCSQLIHVVQVEHQVVMDRDVRAMNEVNHMRRASVLAIKNDEDAGRWWATPIDTPAMRDVKVALRRGPPSDRRILRKLIDGRIAHHWEPRKPID